MKAYINSSGKGKWSNYWGDKITSRIRRIFKKSARQASKRDILKSSPNYK